MKQFSEYVSLGHPDKVADYISQYILDRYIEHDPLARYAVEVQIKNNQVSLAGEAVSTARFSYDSYREFVMEALREIGYTDGYSNQWGIGNTVCPSLIRVHTYIKHQSTDIARGLSGWGDQGIFFGHATACDKSCGMPLDHYYAQTLCRKLFDSGLGGIDIKTQVVMDGEKLEKVIVAIPLQEDTGKDKVERLVRELFPGGGYKLIINGTGRYVIHSTLADCGTTGRKLAVDFYGGNCRIGGGCPWTKDASKADLTLNLYARELAVRYAKEYGVDVFTKIACCIGKTDIDYCVTDAVGNIFEEGTKKVHPVELRERYGLDKPIFASMCRWGLFGQYQQDKAWEWNNININQ